MPAKTASATKKKTRKMTQIDALMAIYERDNRVLTPRAVVDEARPESSPLHKAFEWDDTVAGEKYRLLQAQDLIRSFKCTITSSNNKTIKGVMFVNLSVERTHGKADNGYRLVQDVQKCPDLMQVAVEDALRELKNLKNRYVYLTQLQDIWDVIDKHTTKKKA